MSDPTTISLRHLARKLKPPRPRRCKPIAAKDPDLLGALKATGVSLSVFQRSDLGNIRRGRRGREFVPGSLAHHRWVVWGWLRDHTQLSLPEIGRLTGCAHSSVFMGLKRLREVGG